MKLDSCGDGAGHSFLVRCYTFQETQIFKTCIWLKMHWTFIYSLLQLMFKGFTHKTVRQQNMHNVHSKFSSVGGGNFKEYAEHIHPCWRVNDPITKTSKLTIITNNFNKILLQYQPHHCCSKLMQLVAHKDFCHF